MNTRRWIKHFEENRLHRPEPDWESPFTLPEAKRKVLATSLAKYQLGDGGGPCGLIVRDAEKVIGSEAERKLVIDLWFQEEREHSRLLSHAVRRVKGEFVQSTFGFRLSCGIRRWIGATREMLVLLIVEIVSTGYYRVLRRHVGDRPIDQMCRLILRDEAGHIAFHRDRIAALHPNGVSWWWLVQFFVLGRARAWFLWLGHGRVLRELGASRAEFFEQVARGMYRFARVAARRPIPAKSTAGATRAWRSGVAGA